MHQEASLVDSVLCLDIQSFFFSIFFPLQVNIIPIIAKSDAISKSELTKFKIKITSELVSNGVQIYQFPTDDESVAEINGTMNVSHKQTRHVVVLCQEQWRSWVI